MPGDDARITSCRRLLSQDEKAKGSRPLNTFKLVQVFHAYNLEPKEANVMT
jgi:hypothetical protein